MHDDLAEFCDLAHPRLVAALAHHTGDRWLAEELAQEALIRACDRWERVRTLEAPIGWCFRVGANLAASRFRRRAAERRALTRMRATSPVDLPDTDAQIAVRTALLTLTPAQREAVVLRFYLGLTTEEAAATLGSTPGAVRGLTHRALAALRETLDVALMEEVRDV